MTTPSITTLIFGSDTEPPPCRACSGIGLLCIEPDEDPLLCATCGGSGFGNVLAYEPADDPRQLRLRLDLHDEPEPEADLDDDFLIVDPNFLARYRKPMSEAEMDEAAASFGAALMRGLAEFEDGSP